jgi:hypothetical protein
VRVKTRACWIACVVLSAPDAYRVPDTRAAARRLTNSCSRSEWRTLAREPAIEPWWVRGRCGCNEAQRQRNELPLHCPEHHTEQDAPPRVLWGTGSDGVGPTTERQSDAEPAPKTTARSIRVEEHPLAARPRQSPRAPRNRGPTSSDVPSKATSNVDPALSVNLE